MAIQIRELNGVLSRFLTEAETAMRAESLAMLRDLQRLGQELGPPDAKPIGDGIWELRPKAGRRGPRQRATLLYGFYEGSAIFLRCFYKPVSKADDPTAAHKQEAARLLRRIKLGEDTAKWTASTMLN